MEHASAFPVMDPIKILMGCHDQFDLQLAPFVTPGPVVGSVKVDLR
jgi:hypothetical protein